MKYHIHSARLAFYARESGSASWPVVIRPFIAHTLFFTFTLRYLYTCDFATYSCCLPDLLREDIWLCLGASCYKSGHRPPFFLLPNHPPTYVSANFSDIPQHVESGPNHRTRVSPLTFHNFVLPTHLFLYSKKDESGEKNLTKDFVKDRSDDLDVILIVVSSASCVSPHVLTGVIGWSVLLRGLRLHHLHPPRTTEGLGR